MNTSDFQTDAGGLLARSSLCSKAFRKPPSQLRQARPPRWLAGGLAAALIAAALSGATVLLSPMDEYVNAPGEIRPSDFTFVYSRVEGVIESVAAADGMHVEKGQVLARLDAWEEIKAISQLEAMIGKSKEELNLAQATSRKITAVPVPPEFLFSSFEVDKQKEIQDIQQDYLARLKHLEKVGAASGTELLNVRLQLLASEMTLSKSRKANDLYLGEYGTAARAEAEMRAQVAAAEVARLENDLAAAREDLKRLEIIAPESGRILSMLTLSPGEKVHQGEPLFKIAATEGISLRLFATEDRVNLIAPGQIVRFRANNNPDRLAPLATGVVTEVALDRELNSRNEQSAPDGTYHIEVTIDDAPYPLAMGAGVQAEIVIARRPFWRLLFFGRTR